MNDLYDKASIKRKAHKMRRISGGFVLRRSFLQYVLYNIVISEYRTSRYVYVVPVRTHC